MIRAGVLILLLVVYQLWGTGIHTTAGPGRPGKQFEAQQQAAAEPTTADRHHRPTTTGATDATIAAAGRRPHPASPSPASPIGQIDHPADRLQLRHGRGRRPQVPAEGPGHFPGTPLPGQAGNAAVAGHRTTYKAPFNRIDELQPGDDIFITTLQGTFTYQVMPQAAADPGGPPLGHRIVKPNAVEILADKGATSSR